MPAYCEVALPVPLDRTFTYAVREGQVPLRGARVIAPFNNEKLIGVVTKPDALAPPDVKLRFLEAVLDEEPLLSEHLLALAEWMAQYYLAPLGEVLRGMLPLMAEVRRTVYYRITDLGRDVLAGSLDGDSRPRMPAGERTSRAEVHSDFDELMRGLKPPAPSGLGRVAKGLTEERSAGAKAPDNLTAFTARLKSCPDAKRDSSAPDAKEDSPTFDTKQDSSALDAKEDSPTFDTKQDSSALDAKEDSSTFDTKQDSSALDAKEDSSTFDTKQDSSALDAKEDCSNFDAKQDSLALDAKGDSSTFDTKQDSSALDAKEDSSTFDTKQDSSALDAKEDSSTFDTKQDSSALDAKEDCSNFDAKQDSLALDAKGDSSTFDTKQDSSALDAKEDSSAPPFPSPGGSGKRRGKLSAEELDLEHRVLARLASGEAVKVSTLRTATAATLPVLAGLTRKKWIARETTAAERDARRTERFAVLISEARLPALTEKQQAILAELAACGGELPLSELRRKELPTPRRQGPVGGSPRLPSSTLQTLVRRGLVRIEERAAAFRMGGLQPVAEPFKLNEPQTEALAGLAPALGGFKPFLLHGVTGSGKTAVYLAAMQRALDCGLASILLVPEIGLTPQSVGLLDAAFGARVALLHSALTPEERSEQWRRIRSGDAPIVVGTRSAIFAPAPNLGLILVDEEHDQSYKQEETPRYNARDVAVMRAKLEGAVVVLGSATPSLESWQNTIAQNGGSSKYARIEMRERVMNRPLPEVELIDMRQEFKETAKDDLFSRALIEQTHQALDRGEQALILLNRRGYSFAVICRACGEKLECQNCAISLTHHKPTIDEAGIARAGQRLECHYCGFRRTVPARCPKCDSEHLYYLGAGSQQGEERLGEIFPTARIGRMDRDTVRGRYDLERLLARLHSGEINLLVGTQMIAKGHDIHGITLVGVVGCDHALSMPDFRAAERVFQLMTQVSGRAGRGDLPGRVVVQTYYPDHYAIVAASKHDYASFVERELKYRRWMHYPPFGVLANVLVQSAKLEEAAKWSLELGKWLEKIAPEGVRVLGPCTAPIARIKGTYRFHMILKASSRKALNAALRGMLAHADDAGVPRRNLIVDVDALRLM